MLFFYIGKRRRKIVKWLQIWNCTFWFNKKIEITYLSSSNFAHTSGSRCFHLNLVVIFLVGWFDSFALSGSRTRIFHLFFGFGSTWGPLFQDLKKGVRMYYLSNIRLIHLLFTEIFLYYGGTETSVLRPYYRNFCTP